MAISERTLRRDKYEREAQTVAMLKLARELERLSHQHPDCSDILNVATVQVRWRSRATRSRDEAILKCLRHTSMTVDEICEEIFISPSRDGHRRMRAAITIELIRLSGLGLVDARDRDGEPMRFNSDGKPRRTPYYSAIDVTRGHAPTSRRAESNDNALAAF